MSLSDPIGFRPRDRDSLRDEQEAQIDRLHATIARLTRERDEEREAKRLLAEHFVATTRALEVDAYADKAYGKDQIAARTKLSQWSQQIHANKLASAAVAGAKERR